MLIVQWRPHVLLLPLLLLIHHQMMLNKCRHSWKALLWLPRRDTPTKLVRQLEKHLSRYNWAVSNRLEKRVRSSQVMLPPLLEEDKAAAQQITLQANESWSEVQKCMRCWISITLPFLLMMMRLLLLPKLMHTTKALQTGERERSKANWVITN